MTENARGMHSSGLDVIRTAFLPNYYLKVHRLPRHCKLPQKRNLLLRTTAGHTLRLLAFANTELTLKFGRK
jgi:hypothetical protein